MPAKYSCSRRDLTNKGSIDELDVSRDLCFPDLSTGVRSLILYEDIYGYQTNTSTVALVNSLVVGSYQDSKKNASIFFTRLGEMIDLFPNILQFDSCLSVTPLYPKEIVLIQEFSFPLILNGEIISIGTIITHSSLDESKVYKSYFQITLSDHSKDVNDKIIRTLDSIMNEVNYYQNP